MNKPAYKLSKRWEDLERRLEILAEILVTKPIPDITLISEETKQLILIQLQVPSKIRIEMSGELKKNNTTQYWKKENKKVSDSACKP